MTNQKYLNALSRDDVSQWLVHFTKPKFNNGEWVDAAWVLRSIINNQRVEASMTQAITRYHPNGAACFYDVPLKNWDQLIETNPNGRQAFGVVVSKAAFWAKGGRPAIYTENPNSASWPQHERYRLIMTALDQPSPVDWTHEREWRVPSNLELGFESIWWWPCVPKIGDAISLFKCFKSGAAGINVILNNIYVNELKRVISRSEVEVA